MNNCKHCGNPIGLKPGFSCNTCISRIRRYKTKLKAVEYKGGKCVRCGFSSHIAALEFHHPNDDKKFNLGEVKNKKWKSIVEELDKCELICSNCHRIEHSKYDSIDLIIENGIKLTKEKIKNLKLEKNKIDIEILRTEVWETPSSTLCKKYNITDTGLGKICKKFKISKPARGYWSKNKMAS